MTTPPRIPFQGGIEFTTADGKGVETLALEGEFLKSIVDNGNNTFTVTFQDASNAERTVIITEPDIPAHDGSAAAHGSVEQGLEGHIAHHPGGAVAGPPGAGTVGRASLTAALLTDVDAHADQAALNAHTSSTHNTDAAARGAAMAAQVDIDQHEAAHPAGYTDAEADLRVQAAKGTATPGNTPGGADAGTSDEWTPIDHDHGITPGMGGGGTTYNFQGALVETGNVVVFDPQQLAEQTSFSANDSPLITDGGDNDNPKRVTRSAFADGMVNAGLQTAAGLAAHAGNANAHHTPGTGGLSEADVDARVAAGVLDWAEEGNTDQIPTAKLPATSATTQTITGTVRAGTPAVAAPIADNSDYSAAHGLGAVPDLVDVIATCTTATQGYAVGDVVTLNNDKDRLGVWVNATMVGFSTHPSRGAPYLINRTNRATESLTNASWSVSAIPYVYEDQEVAGLTGPAGPASTVPGPAGADSTVPGPPGPAGMDGVGGGTPADGSITTAKLADGAVTEPKLGQSAVTHDKIAANAIVDAHIRESTISEAKLLIDNGPEVGKLLGYNVTGLHWEDAPAGGAGTDQTARDANTATQAELDTHEASTHNTDAVARSAAANAQQFADAAVTAAGAAQASATAAQSTADLAQVTASDAHAEADAAQADIDAHKAAHPGGGGGTAGAPELIGTGTVTANHNNALDTGINMPSAIADNDLFTVFVENTTVRQHSGSFSFTGSAWKALTDWGVGQAEGNSNVFGFDQGDSQDDEFFIGHTAAGDVLISSDAGTNDDLNIVMFRGGGGGGGGGGLPALPAPGNRDVVTNAAGTAYALAPHLSLDDIFPRVAAIPDHTAADAPAFVYLDHSITEGMREDANMTIGEAAGFYGYSRLPPAFGSINKDSPLGQLVGQATANSITEVWSTNAAWLGQFTHIVLGGVEYALVDSYQSGPWHIRNITSPPTGITALTLNVNFKKADGAYFFQGAGHTVLFNEGWYELLPSGYSRIASTGYLHTSGQGGPIGQPAYEGQRFVNEFGQLWVAGGERARVTVAAGGTSSLLVHDEYNRDPTTVQQNFNATGNGGFAWDFEIESGDGGFYQFQGTAIGDIVYGLTWNQVWTYICTLPGENTAANIRRRDHSSWLGGFRALSGALHELSQRVTQSVFDAGATDYYCGLTGILPQTQRGVRQILTYIAATTVITNDLFWKGPLLDENDVQALIDEGAVDVNGAAVVDQGNANRITVGGQTWGTKPVQDRRAAGLPAATIDTLDNLFEDTRGVWRGSSFVDEERDGVGTFTDVAFGTAPFIGIFGRLTGLESLHPASGQAAGNFAIVEHAPNPGFYSVVSSHWVLAHTDAEVQALLDSLTGNSAGDSRYWGWHGNAVLAMHRRGAIDSTKKYYFFNYTAQRVQLLTNSTYVAGTEAGTIEYNFTLVTPASFPGGGEVVLYETANAGIAIGNDSALIPGNIVCPVSGHLEIYAEQLTGDRQGSISYSVVPAARLRAKIDTVGTTFNNDNINFINMTLGANRVLGISCITTTFYMMLNCQSAGNFYVHIAHRP